MDKRTFLKNSLIGTVSTAAFAAYPVTLLHDEKETAVDEVRKQFENELKSNLSKKAYNLYFKNKEYKKYAEEIIGKEKDAYYAYLMHCDCGSSREWAERIIEEQKNAGFAYHMHKDCGSSREWAEKIIEERKHAGYAYAMYSYSGSSREWYENVERSSKLA